MTNPASSALVHLPVRTLSDLSRSNLRGHPASEGAVPVLQPTPVWQALSLVLHQQLSHDTLLLWQAESRTAEVRLVAMTPAGALGRSPLLRVNQALSDLLAGRLEAVAHVHCAFSDCPLEQVLWDLGMYAGITTPLATGARPLMMTVGFRERWQLVAHHTSAVVALAAYLGEACQALAPGPAPEPWFAWPCHSPYLWHQPWRPSLLRTVNDLHEVLAEMADQSRPCRVPPASYTRTQIARLAHKAGDLMARLESIYWDSRPTISTEELLSEALLLVRGAYQLARGDWPGCLAAVGPPPPPHGISPAALRHALVDWVLAQLWAEQGEAGADATLS